MIAERPRWTASNFVLLPLMAGCFLLTSCESEPDRMAVYPVRGKLMVDDQPADGALVVFHRETPLPAGMTNPNARVAADGSFKLTTWETADGAPSGEYVVTVLWPEPPKSPVDHPMMGTDRLQKRYANPETSEIRIVIAEEENNLDPIRLSTGDAN